jgi:tRNA A37 threonylcarbamoyladenosine synthetase subunit TsaC/SUA5/YrdC
MNVPTDAQIAAIEQAAANEADALLQFLHCAHDGKPLQIVATLSHAIALYVANNTDPDRKQMFNALIGKMTVLFMHYCKENPVKPTSQ